MEKTSSGEFLKRHRSLIFQHSQYSLSSLMLSSEVFLGLRFTCGKVFHIPMTNVFHSSAYDPQQ